METGGDDFWVTMRTRIGLRGRSRASFSHADLPLGHIETGPPSTRNDLREANKGVSIPVVAHETGQFQVYPNFYEIAKYTGVVEARNFQIFRERLDAVKQQCDVIQDIRILGTMIGIELSIDGADVVQACLDRNLLVNCTQGKVIRLLPAMTLTPAEVEEGCDILAEAILDVAGRQ